ncbi:sphingolipid delta-4 desaturase [Puccinia sorghi]|uniref:Sphingolipid delta-4 desaturase n=1 Tax=Puccinia sorghi TaxID=27349 RepID=A0A0L6V9T0_9BASI|nr:sphingolipid delta-4 desaturase [Puccinia sorghi]
MRLHMMIIKFIFDNNVGLFSRVKRLPLGPHLPIVPFENLAKEEDRKNI